MTRHALRSRRARAATLATAAGMLLAACASPAREPATTSDPAWDARTIPARDGTRAASRRGSSFLGALVEDRTGAALGTVGDLLIAPRSGEIVGVVVSLDAPDGSLGEHVLDAAAVVWSEREGEPVLSLSCSAAELDGRGDHAELFEQPTLASVEGEVKAAETRTSGGTCSVLAKVRDTDNVLHRVWIEPAHLLGPWRDRLEPGATLAAEGALTRDETGKLLVASALGKGDARLDLRDEAGAIRWNELAARFRSARGLPGRPIALPDESILRISGWILDPAQRTVPYFCVRIDGVERALPWVDVRSERDEETGDATWRLERDAASLATLPIVSADGRVSVP